MGVESSVEAARRGVMSRGSAISPPTHAPVRAPENERANSDVVVKAKGSKAGGESVTAISVTSPDAHETESNSLGAGAVGRRSESDAAANGGECTGSGEPPPAN